jgi:hypothetical protein
MERKIMIEIKLKLSSGKEINLTAEEYEELNRTFEKKIYIPYRDYPYQELYPNNPYPYPTVIYNFCNG